MVAGSIRKACVPRRFHRSDRRAEVRARLQAAQVVHGVVAQCLKSSSTCLGACEARARCAVWWVRGTFACGAAVHLQPRPPFCMTLSGSSRSSRKAIPLAHAFQKIAKKTRPTGLRHRIPYDPTESSTRQPCILGTLATPWSWTWTPAVSRTGGQS